MARLTGQRHEIPDQEVPGFFGCGMGSAGTANRTGASVYISIKTMSATARRQAATSILTAI